MVRFNFLPWRETLLRYQQKKLVMLVAIFGCMNACVAFSLHVYLNHQAQLLRHQTVSRHEQAAQQKQQVNANQADIIAWQKILADQKANRALFSILNQPIQQAICFTEITAKDKQTVFVGHANTMAELIAYFNQSNLASLFSDIKIEQLALSSDANQVDFRFRADEMEQNK